LVDKASDEPTADLLTQRLTVHEQAAWMLRSLLDSGVRRSWLSTAVNISLTRSAAVRSSQFARQRLLAAVQLEETRWPC
jgi:hypothetical protein